MMDGSSAWNVLSAWVATILPLVLVTTRSISTKGVMPTSTATMASRVHTAGLPREKPFLASTASVLDCQGSMA